MTREVRFPGGVVMRATRLADRDENATWRTFGLYLDLAWHPTWPARVLDWPDFGLPASGSDAVAAIRDTFERAQAGDRVEIGCIGGLGRTGTVLACMAILAGVPVNQAVDWVRAEYDPGAVETMEQANWVEWFATQLPAAEPQASVTEGESR